VSVVVRKLEGYHQPLQRVFSRYEIPFFLDRRESVAHHPLAELTRSAVRTVAFQWRHDDWFAALKTGLVPADEVEIDRLENEALARGWKGPVWRQAISVAAQPDLTRSLEHVRQKIFPPFQKLALQLAARQNRPAGPQLAEALRDFWKNLDVERQLQSWSDALVESFPSAIGNRQSAVHSTVWVEMNSWLDNVELAFLEESLPLREWLPILEAGLASLTVGVIPPALDQVLVGAIDRSRNPDIKLALVLGMNETIFPAPPEPTALLTDADCAELEKRNVVLGSNARYQLGRERYFGYIACTRARQRLVLTCSAIDANNKPLNPSPFLSQIQRLFPSLALETLPRMSDWRESEHASELIAPLIKTQTSKAKNWEEVASIPAVASVIEGVRHFTSPEPAENLSPELAERLYGPTLRTSVSRLEQFAACPFRFFVHSGLLAEERQLFELDVREQGSFQHDALRLFHEQLREENTRWRDITPAEARERIGRIARALAASYRDGLLQASEETRFTARVLTESLQDFVETAVVWMREQYAFDPVAVELAFGENGAAPAWELDLGNGHRLALHGRIDRVDLCRDAESGEAFCVVVDYKSSQKQLDSLLVAHGLQLQLLAYLNVLRRWPNPCEFFGAPRLVPAGVFYVNLRGKYDRAPNRHDALAEVERARRLAYRHSGRFDARVLRKLDGRPDARQGDQFNYRLNNDGSLHKGSREALATDEFEALLEATEANLIRLGREIFSGAARVDPFRKGAMTACDQCGYQSICRIDPWTHRYRVLKKLEAAE